MCSSHWKLWYKAHMLDFRLQLQSRWWPFWVMTHPVVVLTYWYRCISFILLYFSWFKNILTDIWRQTSSPIFKEVGPIGCPETSVRNYHYPLHINPEECSFAVIPICCIQAILKSFANSLSFMHMYHMWLRCYCLKVMIELKQNVYDALKINNCEWLLAHATQETYTVRTVVLFLNKVCHQTH
jgi:hypothetical protein